MRKKFYAVLLLIGLITTLAAFGLSKAAAASANISRSYRAGEAVRGGSIVSLDPKKQDYVVPADISNGSQLLGIAVSRDGSLIAVDPSDAAGTVQVATSGSATALVSTLNGPIAVGDQVAVSPFSGVGMKALPGSRVIGLAQTAFNDDTPGGTTERIKDRDGRTTSVKVGYTQVSIAIGTNATVLSEGNLNALQKAVKSVTGRTVSPLRVALSLAVAVIAVLALVTLIYASIYGSIVSIGRNPLAKYAVFRTLGSVMALALLTAVIAGTTIYFLLK
ncbi:MAG TPA: hypothetical protein VFX84_01195 [Candidatus Saccharimonadales bacterium]|nr:hypothetical protein [Candidatus Saccharimonadales bacterium]